MVLNIQPIQTIQNKLFNNQNRGDLILKKKENFFTNKVPKRITLSWSNLSIKAKSKSLKDILLRNKNVRFETILDQIKGIVEPGEMLALMGPSGSGKTTLLNALNYSIKGNLVVDGKIMINGYEANSTRMSMVSCYIQQDDLFFGTLTVREHLVFNAMLRMDRSVSKEAKMRRVHQVLKEFNLENRADVKIGIPGRIKGISGGEKRRLSFASEILTDPPLLFCDEPTSGLDSYMAKSIVYYLRKMAQAGKTIVCTIHQPSSETFAIFDKICILSQTKLAYFGSRENALNFFTNNLHKTCPPFTNPADFYMDVLGVDVNDSDNSRAEIHNYCEVYSKSEFNHELSEKISNVYPEYFSTPTNYTPYKSNFFDQMYNLSKRSFLNYFRNRKVVMNDLGMVIITALLGGLIFFQSSEKVNGTCTFDQKSSRIISYAMFYTITVSVIFSMLAAVLVFPFEIPIYLREHSASVYRSDTYYLSKMLLELPLYLVFPAIHATIIYYMIGFGCDGRNFAVFLFGEILVSNAAYGLGHILSIVSSDPNMAVSLTAPAIAIQMLFSGFFLKKTVSTPNFLTYFKYTSIFNYGYDLLMINQWENVAELKCEYDIELLCATSGGIILNENKIRPKNKPVYIIMLLVLIVTFRLMAYAILWAKGKRKSIRIENIFKYLKKRELFTV
nr:ATP-binding cassette transporter Abcg-like8 [Brachionus angularis]